MYTLLIYGSCCSGKTVHIHMILMIEIIAEPSWMQDIGYINAPQQITVSINNTYSRQGTMQKMGVKSVDYSI